MSFSVSPCGSIDALNMNRSRIGSEMAEYLRWFVIASAVCSRASSCCSPCVNRRSFRIPRSASSTRSFAFMNSSR